MRKDVSSIISGLRKNKTEKVNNSYGRIYEGKEKISEERWVTMNGTHVLVDDNGYIKNETIRKNIESTAAKKKELVKKAKDIAISFKKTDLGKIKDKISQVLMSLTTKPNKIVKEDVNIDKIAKEGGCSPKVAKAAADLADGIYDKAAKAEPKITNDIVGSVSKLGGSMYGLDYRLKQPTSLGRKIASDAEGKNNRLESASTNIKDAIRYTAVFDTENFVDGYNNMKSELESKGYKEYRCKNFYTMYENKTSVQKAVQCVFESPDGQKFELQFHTPQSQGVKEVNHPIYEERRSKNSKKVDRMSGDFRMSALSSNVPNPKGVLGIISHVNGVPC